MDIFEEYMYILYVYIEIQFSFNAFLTQSCQICYFTLLFTIYVNFSVSEHTLQKI